MRASRSNYLYVRGAAYTILNLILRTHYLVGSLRWFAGDGIEIKRDEMHFSMIMH